MKESNKLFFVFVSGILLLLFNFPFIEVANKSETFYELPTLYFYIFFIWVLSIGLLYLLSKRLFKSEKVNE